MLAMLILHYIKKPFNHLINIIKINKFQIITELD